MTDGQGLQLEGDANQVDSFAACVRAALPALGNEAAASTATDQIYLEGLSGAAFAPVHDVDEACSAWWMRSSPI